jgi:predicted acetyltransferase
VAALWASESVIYGRFGYGLAAQVSDLEIARVQARLQHPPERRGRFRIVDAAEAAETWAAFYDRALTRHPGLMSRSSVWWRHRIFEDAPDWRGDLSANVYVSYERDGDLAGILRYRTKGGGRGPLPQGTLQVEDLLADDDDAYAAVWEFAFSKDLVATITAPHRRVDEPIYWMLDDPRQLRRTVDDALWLRLVDIPVALGARRYRTPGRLVFSLRDAFVPSNSGTYALEVGADGLGHCARTMETGDIGLHVGDMGAAYLGGVAFSTLAAAGRVRGKPADLQRADAMFGWTPAPWCPEVF